MDIGNPPPKGGGNDTSGENGATGSQSGAVNIVAHVSDGNKDLDMTASGGGRSIDTHITTAEPVGSEEGKAKSSGPQVELEGGDAGSSAASVGPTIAGGSIQAAKSGPEAPPTSEKSNRQDPAKAMSAISAAAAGRSVRPQRAGANPSSGRTAQVGAKITGKKQEEKPRASPTPPSRPTKAWTSDLTPSAAELSVKLEKAREQIVLNEKLYEKYYACARKAAHVRSYGEQRDEEGLEDETMIRWTDRTLQLEEPPLFLSEVKTGDELAELLDYHRDHLMSNLYGVLPTGSVLPKTNPRRHLFEILSKSTQSQEEKDRLDQMLLTADSWDCSAASMIWQISFHKKELRDVWNGAAFTYGKGNHRIVLKATDSFTTAIPRQGLDNAAKELCYSVYLLEQSRLRHSEVFEIGSKAAGMDVLAVKELTSASSTFQPHRWKITYRQLECPPLLFNIRLLNVAKGSGETKIFVQHPRTTDKYFPCAKCLSIYHDATSCKNVHHEAGWKSHSRSIELESNKKHVKLTDLSTKSAYRTQMKAMRARRSPELQQRIDEEKALLAREKAQVAAKAAAEAAKKKEQAARQAAAAVALENQRIHQEENNRLLEHVKSLQRQAKLGATSPASGGVVTAKPATKEPGNGSTATGSSKATSEGSSTDQASSQRKTPAQETPQASPVTNAAETSETKKSTAEADAEVQSTQGNLPGQPVPAPAVRGRGGRRASVTSGAGVEKEMRGRRSSIKSATTAATFNKSGSEHHSRDVDGQQQSARRASYSPRRKILHHETPVPAMAAPAIDAGRAEAKCESQEPPSWTIKGWSKDELAGLDVNMKESKETEEAANQPKQTTSSTTRNVVRCLILDTQSQSPPPSEGSSDPVVATEDQPQAMEVDDNANGQPEDALSGAHVPRPSSPKKRVSTPKGVPKKISARELALPNKPIIFFGPTRQVVDEATADQDDPEFKEKAPSGAIQKSVTDFYTRRAPTEAFDSAQKMAAASAAVALPDVSVCEDEVSACSWEVLFQDTSAAKEDLQYGHLTRDEWLTLLGAHMVSIPGNGACLWIGIYAIRADKTGQRINLGVNTVFHSDYYKRRSIDRLLEHLPTLLEKGSLDEQLVYRRYFKKNSSLGRQETVAAIMARMRGNKAISCNQTVKPERYGGDAEIMGAVLYIREPFFIMDGLLEDGSAAFQMYTLALSIEEEPTSAEYVTIQSLTATRAHKILSTLLRYGCIPMILVLEGSHYTAVRFEDSWYADWSKPTTAGETMKQRMRRALTSLGEYAIPETSLYMPTPQYAPADESQGSMFTPDSNDDEFDDSEQESSSSQRSAPLYPEASTTEAEMVELLSYTNPHLRRKGTLREMWARAEQDNNATAELIMDSCETDGPTAQRFTSVIREHIADLEYVFSLLRSLPFPRIALALLPPSVQRQLGSGLASRGHATSVEDWMTTTPTQETHDAFSNLVHELAEEETLTRKLRSSQRADAKSRDAELKCFDEARNRSLPSSDDAGWLILLTLLVLMDDTNRTLEEQCKRAQEWISSNNAEARDLVIQIQHHNWSDAHWEFLIEGPSQLTETQSPTQEAEDLR